MKHYDVAKTIIDKENMPKSIEKGFYGFDLPREKLFTYPWETVEMKENHPDQKIENIFY